MEQQILDHIVENLVRAIPVFHRKLTNILDIGFSRDISHYHFAILGMLSRSDALPVSEISSRLAISKPQMTALIDKLENLGMVKRTPDTSDRRIIRVSLTPKGKATLNQAVKHIKINISKKLSQLKDEDIFLLSKSLEDIVYIGSKLK